MKDVKAFGAMVFLSGVTGLTFASQMDFPPIALIVIPAILAIMGLLMIAGAQKKSYDRD